MAEISMSPSGALSPYYYKGGYFHGIHYGSFFDDTKALFEVMDREEQLIQNSSEMRRILIDLYETNLTDESMQRLVSHIANISSHIFKLGISAEKKKLRAIRRAIKKSKVLPMGLLYCCIDMETVKTWLVSDKFEH